MWCNENKHLLASRRTVEVIICSHFLRTLSTFTDGWLLVIAQGIIQLRNRITKLRTST
jgi:hypothetical protein